MGRKRGKRRTQSSSTYSIAFAYQNETRGADAKMIWTEQNRIKHNATEQRHWAEEEKQVVRTRCRMQTLRSCMRKCIGVFLLRSEVSLFLTCGQTAIRMSEHMVKRLFKTERKRASVWEAHAICIKHLMYICIHTYCIACMYTWK